jgi:Asp-tRNA(Asn)/Glu-tRNA(Gln) amidotransferase A subunit family amidase
MSTPGRRPRRDSTVAARLRAAGAVILGKTVTTEFAAYQPGKTRHPFDRRHTPGGSSSGSAAAVAAGMVPLAIGSQTNGSVIRPASYCGVVGYKPTHGLISRAGMFRHQAALDHVGVFARSVEDAALLTDALAGPDPADPDTFVPAGSLVAACGAPLAAPPRLVALRLPWMDRLEPEAASVFAGFVRSLGHLVVRRALPDGCAEALRHHQVLHETGLAFHLAREYATGADRLSPQLRAMIEAGQRHGALAYAAALAAVPRLRRRLDRALAGADAFLVPAATGAAPRTRQSTGDPVFSTLWTLCGLPAITLPLLEDRRGMPIGVQLVAPRFADGRLLGLARWLMDRPRSRRRGRR